MDPANLRFRHERIERRRILAGEWRGGDTADRAENELFDACFELVERARELESVAGQRGSAPATAASLGCIKSALEAQATALLKMRSVALQELSTPHADPAADAGDLGRLLYAISQNLRFAAQASDLARAAASRTLESRTVARSPK